MIQFQEAEPSRRFHRNVPPVNRGLKPRIMRNAESGLKPEVPEVTPEVTIDPAFLGILNEVEPIIKAERQWQKKMNPDHAEKIGEITGLTAGQVQSLFKEAQDVGVLGIHPIRIGAEASSQSHEKIGAVYRIGVDHRSVKYFVGLCVASKRYMESDAQNQNPLTWSRLIENTNNLFAHTLSGFLPERMHPDDVNVAAILHERRTQELQPIAG